MNGIAIEISKVPVDCTLTPPIPPHKILFKSKSYFSLQLTLIFELTEILCMFKHP